ncbi:MAG: efflux RND transporter permease subunit [Pseudomonadota bacterium]
MSLMPAGATGFLSYFTRHRTAANLLLVIMLAVGFAAATQIRAQFLPDVVSEEIDIRVTWDGAGPDDVDRAIVAVLEPSLRGIEGVAASTTVAREGRADIDLTFEPGWDMARANEDVTTALGLAANLPDGASDPEIRRGSWRERVTDVIISGPVDRAQLGRFADEFIALLFREGVTRTSIRGVSAPEIDVDVPETALIRHDITLRQIADAIAEEAAADPAGDVAGGAQRVRTGVEKRTADTVSTVVVRANPDGSKLTVGDVAEITVKGAVAGRAYYKGDDPAVSIRIDRSPSGDAIKLQAAVERVAEALAPSLPEGVEIELIRTRAEMITDRLAILLDNGLLGLAIVVCLLFLFLSARTAFWVAMGIPAAMIATIGLMYVGGLTLNMVSLFALIICLGIVVDDAIVVGEHADFRARTLGEPPVVAAENAARRMSLPVLSATVTTVIAFIALFTISGEFGTLVAAIPFTVVAVLVASLIECFLVLPNHMAHALEGAQRARWYDWPSRTVNRGFRWFCARLFRPAMRWILIARYPVLAAAVLGLALSSALFVRGDVTWRFFNSPERGSISGNFAMLPGASRDDSLAMMREMQRAAAATAAAFEAEHGVNPVTFALAEIGGNTGRGLAGQDTKDADLLGSIAIELIDADLRPYSTQEFLGRMQEEVQRHPLLEVLSFRGWRFGPGGDSLNVKFTGADAAVLKEAAQALITAASAFPEMSALEDSLAYDKTELVIELTPLGQALGFTIDGVGLALRQRLGGITAAEFPVGPREGRIEVGLPERELTANFLNETRLRTDGGDYITLSEIVTVSSTLGFSTIRRENGDQVVTVTGDVSEDDPTRAAAVQDALERDILPDIASRYGVSYSLGGLAAQERAFLFDAAVGFGLCLLGIYLTLAWIFSSWSRPFVVMAVIPFGLIGTIYGHWVWDVPLSMFTVVGLIGMSGIIINDSIVLITTIDEYAERRALLPAVIDAVTDRLRPVLLTTLTTVLGLAPLLYETSRQAEFLKPTVITLAYGLGVGMFLVLLVVPSLVILQRDFGALSASARRGIFGARLPLARRWALRLSAAVSVLIVLLTAGAYAALGAVPAPMSWLAGVLGLGAGPGAAVALMVLGLSLTFLISLGLVSRGLRRDMR